MADERATMRLHRLPPRRQLVTAALVAVIAVLAVWLVWDHSRAGRQEELARDNATLIAEQVRQACARRDEIAVQLGDLCRQADEVIEEPAEPVTIPPTDEQLRPLVQQYVDDWLASNPPRDGRTPTVDELTTLITLHLASNPPPAGEDGRTPTAADIRPIVVDVVAAHLLANPPPPGEAGQDGEDGADSTVPGPPGVDGEVGEDGEPPHSWTTTRCDVIGRCVTERCERTDPFDPDAPTYVCSEDET